MPTWKPSAARTLILPVRAASPRGFVQTPVTLRWPDKRAAELLDYSVDFGNWLDADDTLTALSVVSSPTTLPTLFIGALVITGAIATVWIDQGLAGTDYVVTITAPTQLGRRFSIPVRLFLDPSPDSGATAPSGAQLTDADGNPLSDAAGNPIYGSS